MTKLDYTIDMMKIHEGITTFEFSLGTEFFAMYAKGVMDDGKVDVKVSILKEVKSFTCNIEIDGYVDTQCDRCLSDIQTKVENDLKLTVVLTDEPEGGYDGEEEIIFVSRNQGKLNLAEHFYDMVLLALPMRKSCEDSLNRTECEEQMLQKMNDTPPEDGDPDPRWEGLKKLLDN